MSEYFAENYYPKLVFTTKKFNSIWCQLLLATKLKVLGKIWDGRLLLNLLEIVHTLLQCRTIKVKEKEFSRMAYSLQITRSFRRRKAFSYSQLSQQKTLEHMGPQGLWQHCQMHVSN